MASKSLCKALWGSQTNPGRLNRRIEQLGIPLATLASRNRINATSRIDLTSRNRLNLPLENQPCQKGLWKSGNAFNYLVAHPEFWHHFGKKSKKESQ